MLKRYSIFQVQDTQKHLGTHFNSENIMKLYSNISILLFDFRYFVLFNFHPIVTQILLKSKYKHFCILNKAQ